MLRSIEVVNFNLKETLDSGQFFLYYLIDDFFYIINGQNVFKVKQEDNFLFYDNITEDDLIYFFSLDVDYDEIYKEFEYDEYLKYALKEYRGLRIMRQDFWQCIVSFVCSSCANIDKIKKNLRLICEFFGEKVIYDGQIFYTFPKVGSLNDYDKLIDAKTGYRASFLYDINRVCKEDDNLLDFIESLDYEDAKKQLMNFSGIGPKVADCICLFALRHLEAFPIDTWIRKVVENLYLKKKSNVLEMESFARDYFGDNIGIKQQYLFHFIRNQKK